MIAPQTQLFKDVPWTPAELRAFVAYHQLRQVDIGRVYGARQSFISGLLTGRERGSRKTMARLRAAIEQVLQDGRSADEE